MRSIVFAQLVHQLTPIEQSARAHANKASKRMLPPAAAAANKTHTSLLALQQFQTN